MDQYEQLCYVTVLIHVAILARLSPSPCTSHIQQALLDFLWSTTNAGAYLHDSFLTQNVAADGSALVLLPLHPEH